jgi:aspartate/methionine/tyrosine aminotransferase
VAGEAVPASIFARLREHLAKFPGDVIPLQIGDTHLAPPASLDNIAWGELPAIDTYAYGAPGGWEPLVDEIILKARTKNGIALGTSAVQVTCGATHALSCAVQALCDRRDELLLLTPHWPLIRGIALAHGVTPVEVPFGDLERIEAAITPRTTGIYYASPNNPDGAMLSPDQLAGIARLADKYGLWIFADEVYEDYGYEAQHASIAAIPEASQRTVTVFSFAKSYAQAGLRVGYALAHDRIAAAMKKLVNHSVYNVPVAMQRAALQAMRSGESWLAGARTRYRAARDRARGRLRVPSALPPGGAYLWVDFSEFGPDCMPSLEKIAEAGVLLAPGSAFGDACRTHARLCFTGVDEDRLDEGIDRINSVLR